MAYQGELLKRCPSNAYDFSKTFAVVVSGSTGNRCGHMLLNLGGVGGLYLQVAMGEKLGEYTKVCPRYMNEAGYRRYIREESKRELRRLSVKIPYPDKAMLKLEELLSKPWSWWGLWRNCETFVEEIIVAGGGPKIHSGMTYCPVDSSVQ